MGKSVKPFRQVARDFVALGLLSRWSWTSEQVARLAGFPSSKKASERLHLLFRAGLVGRTRYVNPSQGVGNAAWLYSTKSPLRPALHHHAVRVGDFHVWFAGLLPTIGPFLESFLFPGEFRVSGGVQPDSVILLERDGVVGLWFVEIDCGTERIESSVAYSLASKFRQYAHYLDSEAYRRDFADVADGFRVALVLPSSRERSVQELLARQGLDFVLLATFDRLAQQGACARWWAGDGRWVDFLGREQVGE